MEETTISVTKVITTGEINRFKYVCINDVKYFIGDFIKIDVDGKKDTKYRIDDILFSSIIVSTLSGASHHYLFSTIKEFYYKKDYKKYCLQKKSRIYETDLNCEVIDCLGNTDILGNMIYYKGKLYSKSVCGQTTDSYLDNVKPMPFKEINRLSYKLCELSNVWCHPGYVNKVYIIDAATTHITNIKFVHKKLINTVYSTYTHYFSIIDNNINLDSTIIPVLNGEELLKNDNFIIGPKSSMIIRKDRLKKDDTYKMYPNGYYFPEFNNLQSKTKDIAHNYKFGLDSNTHLITEGLKYTFGVEIEMADCCFPPHFLTDMNIKVEKDGSIRNTRNEKYGPEVITGVLKGDKGFEHLQYICTELAKRSELNHTCGIHTHIGNANFNNANIVMLFKLAKTLENDIFNMLPASRRKNEYCRLLPNLDFNFNNCKDIMDLKIRIDNYYTELFTLAANCPPNDKVNKTKNHPKGAKVGYDHSNIRYCWINFIPALFNTRNTNPPIYTIEFRPFNASTNFIKIKNWVKICMGIVNFSENYHKDIINSYISIDGIKEPITLKNVMKKVYPKSYRKLNEFIDSRTEIFTKTSDEDFDASSTNEKLKIKELI
jgi:hypothetical protein